MVANGMLNGNGYLNGSNGTHAFIMKPCPSDYEATIDMVPFEQPQAKPAWAAQRGHTPTP